MTKMFKLVGSCKECPNYVYYSGGAYQCSPLRQTVLDGSTIAPFCPLPDYPDRIIAGMDTTIKLLREPSVWGLQLAIMSHIATKLGAILDSRGGIKLLVEEEDVYLSPDRITHTDRGEIHFVSMEAERKDYKLYPDVTKPTLCRKWGGDGEHKDKWENLKFEVVKP